MLKSDPYGQFIKIDDKESIHKGNHVCQFDVKNTNNSTQKKKKKEKLNKNEKRKQKKLKMNHNFLTNETG